MCMTGMLRCCPSNPETTEQQVQHNHNTLNTTTLHQTHPYLLQNLGRVGRWGSHSSTGGHLGRSTPPAAASPSLPSATSSFGFCRRLLWVVGFKLDGQQVPRGLLGLLLVVWQGGQCLHG